MKCFVIMPISDTDDYPSGHFNRVYLHLLRPAIEKAGFEATRADEIQETNFIVLDIVQHLFLYFSTVLLCAIVALVL